jgi:uncharacterized protein YchJ
MSRMTKAQWKESRQVVHFNGKMLPIVNAGIKVGRNMPCPCGSGVKFKHCHYEDIKSGKYVAMSK